MAMDYTEIVLSVETTTKNVVSKNKITTVFFLAHFQANTLELDFKSVMVAE
jgi:hypothetical protein